MNRNVSTLLSSIEGSFEICGHDFVTVIFCSNGQLLRYRSGGRGKLNTGLKTRQMDMTDK